MSVTEHWWHRAVFYEVYARSFKDSDGDGSGDLEGIRTKLPYLRTLGVTAVWITPVFPSPMKDWGYDVSDYREIDPSFGTMADMDALLQEAHTLGLRVILDFVPNHTSDQHPWFRDARSSTESPRRDWYIWRDPGPNGGPPNNWRSSIGTSAWELDPGSGQYYYHAFLREQPDLNWRNPEVREAMFDVMRFWFERGVDGFRVDVIWHLMKDAQFRDDDEAPATSSTGMGGIHVLATRSADQPEVHEVIAEMRAVAEEYEDRFLIGEVYLPPERLIAYYGNRERAGVHLPFNFHLLFVPWTSRAVGELVERYESLLPADGWPNWVLGNHDQPRIATRIGEDRARLAAMLLLTLRGTPTLYYGDELGMTNVEVPQDQVRDGFEVQAPGMMLGRDGQRTPMQWDDGPNAGFTTGRPWLPVAPSYSEVNVAVLSEDPDSVLSLYRRLIAVRQAREALMTGSYDQVSVDEEVLVYRRAAGAGECLVLLNFADAARRAVLPDQKGRRILVSTEMDREGEPVSGQVVLRSFEGVVLE